MLRCLALVGVALCSAATPCSGQDPAAKDAQQPSPAQPPQAVGEPTQGSPEDPALLTLRALRSVIQDKQQELEAVQAKGRDKGPEEDREADLARARELTADLERLRRDEESIAVGIDLQAFDQPERSDFTLTAEVEELLRPLIEELKAATAEPRQMEQLRTAIAHHERREELARQALSNLDKLIARATTDASRQTLERYRETWKERRADAANQAAIARRQLEVRTAERRSLFESTSSALGSFFRNRGLNLLLALLAFGVLFFGMRFASRPVLRFFGGRRKGPEPFYFRLLLVTYHAAVIVLACLAALMVFYVAGDWVLLGLGLLVILGLAWGSKQAVPRFLQEARLVLNLGAVREGERVIFAGVPWRIDRLHLYARLSNPALSAGELRLPLRQLSGLHSRRVAPKEPWFPTDEGDWVLMTDGTRGKVVLQTPEIVQLVKLGGARVTYPTAAFLEQNPLNLSANFRIAVTFGIDYSHQPQSTTTIPAKMQQRLVEAIGEYVGSEQVINLAVELKEAGASSLDYAVLADFRGEAAPRYEALQRRIQRVLVDTCNEEGWIIPFTQLTVHQAQ